MASSSPLSFVSESAPTSTSALLTLVHRLCVYDGFRPLVGGEQQRSPFDLPASLATASSRQTVFTLAYQHRVLRAPLPHHRCTIKLARVLGSSFVLHASIDTGLEVKREVSPDNSNEEEIELVTDAQQAQQSPLPPVRLAPTIYTLRLNADEFIRPMVLQQQSASASVNASTTADPAEVSPVSLAIDSPTEPAFRNVARLLAQLRNRIFKHMLGEEYRAAMERGLVSSSTESFTAASPLTLMPQEILVSVLHHLTSRELLLVGRVNWTLAYAASHPFLWQQLCVREMPVGVEVRPNTDPLRVPTAAEAAAEAANNAPPPTPRSDWKSEYIARWHIARQKRAEDVISTRSRFAELRHFLPRPFAPDWFHRSGPRGNLLPLADEEDDFAPPPIDLTPGRRFPNILHDPYGAPFFLLPQP